MDRIKIAMELVKLARELVSKEFATKEQLNKYLKEHPDADKSMHTVKSPGNSQSKGEDKPKPKQKKKSPGSVNEQMRYKKTTREEERDYDEVNQSWKEPDVAIERAKAFAEGAVKKHGELRARQWIQSIVKEKKKDLENAKVQNYNEWHIPRAQARFDAWSEAEKHIS